MSNWHFAANIPAWISYQSNEKFSIQPCGPGIADFLRNEDPNYAVTFGSFNSSSRNKVQVWRRLPFSLISEFTVSQELTILKVLWLSGTPKFMKQKRQLEDELFDGFLDENTFPFEKVAASRSHLFKCPTFLIVLSNGSLVMAESQAGSDKDWNLTPGTGFLQSDYNGAVSRIEPDLYVAADLRLSMEPQSMSSIVSICLLSESGTVRSYDLIWNNDTRLMVFEKYTERRFPELLYCKPVNFGFLKRNQFYVACNECPYNSSSETILLVSSFEPKVRDVWSTSWANVSILSTAVFENYFLIALNTGYCEIRRLDSISTVADSMALKEYNRIKNVSFSDSGKLIVFTCESLSKPGVHYLKAKVFLPSQQANNLSCSDLGHELSLRLWNRLDQWDLIQYTELVLEDPTQRLKVMNQLLENHKKRPFDRTEFLGVFLSLARSQAGLSTSYLNAYALIQLNFIYEVFLSSLDPSVEVESILAFEILQKKLKITFIPKYVPFLIPQCSYVLILCALMFRNFNLVNIFGQQDDLPPLVELLLSSQVRKWLITILYLIVQLHRELYGPAHLSYQNCWSDEIALPFKELLLMYKIRFEKPFVNAIGVLSCMIECHQMLPDQEEDWAEVFNSKAGINSSKSGSNNESSKGKDNTVDLLFNFNDPINSLFGDFSASSGAKASATVSRIPDNILTKINDTLSNSLSSFFLPGCYPDNVLIEACTIFPWSDLIIGQIYGGVVQSSNGSNTTLNVTSSSVTESGHDMVFHVPLFKLDSVRKCDRCHGTWTDFSAMKESTFDLPPWCKGSRCLCGGRGTLIVKS